MWLHNFILKKFSLSSEEERKFAQPMGSVPTKPVLSVERLDALSPSETNTIMSVVSSDPEEDVRHALGLCRQHGH